MSTRQKLTFSIASIISCRPAASRSDRPRSKRSGGFASFSGSAGSRGGCEQSFSGGRREASHVETTAGSSWQRSRDHDGDLSAGHSGAVHRHNAKGFIYVVEGSVVMGVTGDEPVTLGPGQAFYESPNDIHTIGRNPSKTTPVKFLVFLIKGNDAGISIPVE